MLNDIYNKRIIELAGNIPRLGRLAAPDASATAHSKLCGSTVKVDLKMDGPVVTDFAHDVKACALGQASSSIMASHVVGSTASELRELRETVRKMLKENGSPPQGKWADIALLEPVRDYKARHASTMLTFDAVVDAIGQIEAKAKQPGERAVISAYCSRRRQRAAGRNHRFRRLGGFQRRRIWSRRRAALLDEAILHRLGGQLRHRRVATVDLRQHLGHRIGGDEIGQPQFGPRQFVQIFPRRHVQRQRQQIAGTTHVEGVFGETPDIAFHDHQIFRGVARGLGVVGAVAHPDLMHPDMRGLGHVARLARQQQKHAHRLAIGPGHDAGTIALRGTVLQCWCRRWSAARDCASAGRARWSR